MSFATEFEMFYTDSEDEELVNQISIDVRRKRYILDENVHWLCTDGYDEEDNPICSIYVSSVIFDILLKGVKDAGFVRYVPEEEQSYDDE